MSTPTLETYTPVGQPVPQVTPFTYRDGVTMLKKVDGIVQYINRTLVPFIEENYAGLADEFNTVATALIEAVNAAIDSVINDSVEVQDDVVAAIFNDAGSDTRTVTDVLYAAKSVVDNLVTLVNSGRLSAASLDAAYVNESAVIDGNHGGTGISTITPFRLLLSGPDSDGPFEFAAAGTAGQVLKSGGAGANPAWGEIVNDAATGATETWSASKIITELAKKSAKNLRGTYAARPTAASAGEGAIYSATDVAEQYVSIGGTWYVTGSGGNELAIAQITSVLTTTSTTPATIGGFTTTFVAGERPVWIEIGWDVASSVANNVLEGRILVDGVQVQKLGASGLDAGRSVTQVIGVRKTYTPGTSHTITVQWLTGLAATLTLNAAVDRPAYVRAVTL